MREDRAVALVRRLTRAEGTGRAAREQVVEGETSEFLGIWVLQTTRCRVPWYRDKILQVLGRQVSGQIAVRDKFCILLWSCTADSCSVHVRDLSDNTLRVYL